MFYNILGYMDKCTYVAYEHNCIKIRARFSKMGEAMYKYSNNLTMGEYKVYNVFRLR